VAEVADHAEDGGECQGAVDGRVWQPWQLDRFALEEATIAGCSVEGGERREERGKCVEAEGFDDLAVEKGRERTRGPAAGALDVEITIDRALRVKRILPRRKAQEDGYSHGEDG